MALRSRGSRRGQALVETALVLPILLMFLLLAIDLGRIFFISIDLRNAAHEVTMFGGTTPQARLVDCGTGDPKVDAKIVVDREMGTTDAVCGTFGAATGVVYITMAECDRANVGPACSPWAPPYPPSAKLHYTVRLQYRFQPVMPLVGLLTGNGVGGSVPMTVENRSPVLVGYGD